MIGDIYCPPEEYEKWKTRLTEKGAEVDPYEQEEGSFYCEMPEEVLDNYLQPYWGELFWNLYSQWR